MTSAPDKKLRRCTFMTTRRMINLPGSHVYAYTRADHFYEPSLPLPFAGQSDRRICAPLFGHWQRYFSTVPLLSRVIWRLASFAIKKSLPYWLALFFALNRQVCGLWSFCCLGRVATILRHLRRHGIEPGVKLLVAVAYQVSVNEYQQHHDKLSSGQQWRLIGGLCGNGRLVCHDVLYSCSILTVSYQ